VTSADDDAVIVSHGAGGFWFPYLVEPMERASVWAADTYREFVRMMEEAGAEEGAGSEAEAGAGSEAEAQAGAGAGAGTGAEAGVGAEARAGAHADAGAGAGAGEGAGPGVRMLDVYLYDDLSERPPRPAWAPADLRELTPEELPAIPALYNATATGGWKFGAPVVEMPRWGCTS
jgi:hypothetical protein